MDKDNVEHYSVTKKRQRDRRQERGTWAGNRVLENDTEIKSEVSEKIVIFYSEASYT